MNRIGLKGGKVWLGVAVPVYVAAVLCAGAWAEKPLDFSRDVQPVIAEHCFTCHGPDESQRKKGLRFHEQDGLLGKTQDGVDLIVPGNSEASLFFQRIEHADPDKRMPPVDAKKALSAAQIDLIRRWIEQGAPWEQHWAFVPPVQPALPEVSDAAWCRNEIDRFILQRIDEAGLRPNPEASKETLVRRLSLDLTGLPPTPAEVDAFVADERPEAYEALVDRLLASPHYGENMAFPWLNAARYADTHGYQRDTKRYMWAWRDWVIQAFNNNMPFDEFTIEQLAGDLLPNSTLAQKIATGFNRNHRINGEGGIIPAEYAVEYVVDRVSTTSETWMGLTMGCAKCHDHKFDPFSQKDFYRLYDFFNRVPEEGKGREQGNDVPVVAVLTPEEQARQQHLQERAEKLASALTAPDERLDAQQQEWEQAWVEKFSSVAWQPVRPVDFTSEQGSTLSLQDDQSIIVSGNNPAQETYDLTFVADGPVGSIRLEVLTDPSLPEQGPGRAPNGNTVLTDFQVSRTRGDAAEPERLKVADALADHSQENGDYLITNAIDGDPATGWATGSHVRRENRTAVFVLEDAAAIQTGDRITVSLKHTSQYGQHAYGRFRLSVSGSDGAAQWARPSFGAWHYIGPFKAATTGEEILDIRLEPEEGYDPEREYTDAKLQWETREDWADGEVIPLSRRLNTAQYLHREVTLPVPMELRLSLGSDDGIKVWVDGDLKLTNNVTRAAAPDQEKVAVFLPEGKHDLLIKISNTADDCGFYFKPIDDGGEALFAFMAKVTTPAAKRDEALSRTLRDLFRAQDSKWLAKKEYLATTELDLEKLEEGAVTTMVMEDMAKPRATYLLKRGEYDKPDTSEQLHADVPAALGPMAPDLPRNRLGLAKWLCSPEHPLTARVQVNLYWQHHFGRGIVKTSEDFGTQGSPPTHPELLDWLALHFIDSGWDIKAMQKLIVMSATYRQSSVRTNEAAEVDPQNLLLARAPRLRLPAQALRDQALAASGLLNPEIGGPSVYPYQPEGMWSSLTFLDKGEYDTNFYEEDTGDKLYRRGLYTYWKRTIPPPRMQIFNAADRERCTLRTEVTNTPMQAMALLDDPTFVEAARHLAQRMLTEGGPDAGGRIDLGYRLLLGTEPGPAREEILAKGLSSYIEHYTKARDEAKALLAVGASEVEPSLDEAEFAAYTMLASVMLNMDEAITRD
ncbi:MAG: DUF1553 domain-containing protein [Candidatus Hydrogenedens sp.]|nr:DUF1553 domain-containing protein [Candidatus Hydrogenedens sp.]